MPGKEDSENVIMYSYVKITLQAMPPTKPYKTLKEGGSLNKNLLLTKRNFYLFKNIPLYMKQT